MAWQVAQKRQKLPQNSQQDQSQKAPMGLQQRLLVALSNEPWRGRLMRVLKLLGYRDEQWIRVVMAEKTKAWVSSIDSDDTQVLEISGWTWANYFPSDRYNNLAYPDFDICQQVTERRFDLIILEQVLEHVLKPADALSNIEASLSPEGYALITTPFMVRYHGHPHDCSRWTETGLRQMLLAAGFEDEDIETGSWGNKSCLLSNLSVWQRYNPYIHRLKNDPRYPLMVWAMAKKSQRDPELQRDDAEQQQKSVNPPIAA